MAEPPQGPPPGESGGRPAPTTVRCTVSEGFSTWLAEHQLSLAVTTYQAGKLLLIGWNGTQVSLNARHFDQAMGLDVAGDALALATRDRIHRFADASLLAPDFDPGQPGRYDALYLHRASFFTGPLFIHDVGFAADGELWFVNTRFSCLATLSGDFSFVPRWQPPFISELAPEDRCHLNGLAMRDGRPHAATALGVSDTPRGWRDHKVRGGVVLDIGSGEVLLGGLSMPHSPRWHRDRLWVLNSGTGELLRLAPDGRAEAIAALPAYLRGLAFVDGHALVGLCKIREKRVFGGLPVEERVSELKCGIALVNIDTGHPAGLFEFTEGVEEIYDIRVLPGIRRPNLIPFDYPHPPGAAITAPEFSYWIGPAGEA